MHQYTYTATHKGTGRIEHIRCTAADALTARWHIANEYQNHDIGSDPSRVSPPHYTWGELDASSPAHYAIANP